MEIINNLKEIASSLNLNDVFTEIFFIEERLKDPNKQLIIPIVGEFSSGKTTLLNALMNSKKLETASKPTTAVVYEIFFGEKKEYAEVVLENDESQIVENISELKNDTFENVSLVKIYDTSTKIPNSTVLVDTPGLSSNDSKHIEALSNYLPNADALILCVDVNQQITNSLIEFIKLNNLAHLPLYIVITKSDTKTSNEIEDVKKYIAKNIDLSYNNLIGVSSLKNEMTEFYSLMDKIQKDKNQIINGVLEFRLEKIKQYLKEYIKNLLDHTESDKSIENEFKKQQRELDKLLNAVNRLIDDTRSEIEEVEYETAKSFSNIVSDKLDSIIRTNTTDADQQAIGTINATSNLIINNFQNDVIKKLYVLAKDRKNTELGIPLRSLESVDVDEIKMSPLSYNIDLASAGQNQVKNISNGIKIAAAIGAVVATAGLASGAVAPAAATGAVSGAATGAMAGGAKAVGTAVKITKVATKVGTVAQVVKGGADTFKKNMSELNQYNIEVGQAVAPNQNQGFVENIVGKVGDSVLGKPQRRKMINDYMESSLIPEFKSKLNIISNNLLQDIQNNLNAEAQLKVAQLGNKLQELKELFTKENELFKAKIENYKNYLTFLNQ